MRCQCVHSPQGVKALGHAGPKLKNLNSFRHVEKALVYEIRRQEEIVADGGK